jgi:hypothetical protein
MRLRIPTAPWTLAEIRGPRAQALARTGAVVVPSSEVDPHSDVARSRGFIMAGERNLEERPRFNGNQRDERV